MSAAHARSPAPAGERSQDLLGPVYPAADWLPPGKQAAVIASVDDIHPGSSADDYEAGGDLEAGVLGRLQWLLQRHPRLHLTLFVTPDWRMRSPLPKGLRRAVATVPRLAGALYEADVHPAGTLRIDRFPGFVRCLRALPRCDIGLHGLHHARRGPRLAVEFLGLSRDECRDRLIRARHIFDAAGVDPVPGMAPPGWELSADLAAALIDQGLEFVCSARDVRTPVSAMATATMSGLRGVSLLHPQGLLGSRLLHLSTNFQATNSFERALEICRAGGVLSIKMHAFKHAYDHVQLDGLDPAYSNYLDLLLGELERRFGDSLWWTSHAAINRRIRRHLHRRA